MQVFGKYLNPEEVAVGALHSAIWIPFLGWWAALGVPASALLWAWGGADGTSLIWRRLGVPVTVCGLIALNQLSWISLCSMPFAFFVLTFGYGIPSWNGPNNTMDDEGSTIGKWVYIKAKGSLTGPDAIAEKQATSLTRAILGAMFGLAMLPLIFFNVIPYIIGTALLILLYPFVVEAF